MPKTTTPATADWCDTDPDSVSAERAQQLIKETVTPVSQVETVAVRAALGRVAALAIKSHVRVPNHTNSAMDGYAINAREWSGAFTQTGGKQPPQKLQIIGVSFAGKPYHGTAGDGQCVRIMTGAVMPAGTDRVVIQEQVARVGDTITVPTAAIVMAGANVRRAGEDMEIGELAIAAGRRLGPAHLGLAASLGFSELPVLRRPRVAFFSNGDELRAVGSALARGELYDSNRYTLYGMLSGLGVEMVDLGIVPDDAAAVSVALEQAAACADVVITSAGASVGEADYLGATVARIGQVVFHKVAIKPGRPLAFGKLGASLFFGLPGNPVSVMVTFEIFVKPALRQLAGEIATEPLRFMAQTTSALKKRAGRAEYQRGVLTMNAGANAKVNAGANVDATMVVRSTGEQGSGILSSMDEANCFIILPTDSAGVAAGEWVEVRPFAPGD